MQKALTIIFGPEPTAESLTFAKRPAGLGQPQATWFKRLDD
jgi:hypothetical protein